MPTPSSGAGLQLLPAKGAPLIHSTEIKGLVVIALPVRLRLVGLRIVGSARTDIETPPIVSEPATLTLTVTLVPAAPLIVGTVGQPVTPVG